MQTRSQQFAVRITYPAGLGGPCYLSHKDRSAWSRRRAQQHAADVRNNRTGIRGFIRVDVVEHG